jgi:hypothetical protein
MAVSSSLAWNFLDKSKVPDASAIKTAIEKRLNFLGIEGIAVVEVEPDIEGDIFITFQDEDGDEMDVVFAYDPEEGPIAVIQDDDEDAEDSLIVDLDGLAPSLVKTVFGTFVNLVDLDWMNKSAFLTIFQAGLLDDNNQEDNPSQLPDPHGYITEALEESDEVITEARKVYVVRGGKRVKLAIVRKVRRKVLTGKQRSAIRKAVRKRRAKKHIISRKRKKALRVRKRLKLKTPSNLSKLQKVAGTANRRR